MGILSAPGGHPGGLCRPYKKNPIQSSEPTYPRGHILFPNEYKEIETQAENLTEITGWRRETPNTQGQPEPFPGGPAWSCPTLGPVPSCLSVSPSLLLSRALRLCKPQELKVVCAVCPGGELTGFLSAVPHPGAVPTCKSDRILLPWPDCPPSSIFDAPCSLHWVAMVVPPTFSIFLLSNHPMSPSARP